MLILFAATACAALLLPSHHRAGPHPSTRLGTPVLAFGESEDLSFCRTSDLLQAKDQATARQVVNVIGRWKTVEDWDTIGLSAELDGILAGRIPYKAPPKGQAVDTAATVRRRDFCINRNLCQRYMFSRNVGLLPFKDNALAASVGATARELNGEPLEPLALDVVFDALMESQGGVLDKGVCDERRAAFDKAASDGGGFDAEAFTEALSRGRRNILLSYAVYPGIPNSIFLLTAIKLDALNTFLLPASQDVLATLRTNYEDLGLFSLLLPVLPLSIIAYGAANPPKANKAAGEAAAADRVYIAQKLRTKLSTEQETPTPTLSE